ncbi:MAG: SUMF1/EgtB/PvdO family nonheme iron enzyme, partial [Microcoleaceae cyanobacterium]
ALNVTGTVIGSAQYCSPEQARGKPIFASDLYSLGVTCIYLLTLVEPFQLFDISENDWVWRDYLVNNPVSEKFSQVLDQLIAMGLKKRFTNVEEIFNCLGYKYDNDKYLEQKSSSEISNTQLQSVPAITNQNQYQIEIVEFTTTIIKEVRFRQGFFGIGKEVITENKKAICQVVKFDLGDNVLLEMVSIPGGIFYMGSNETEYERPIHIVNIQPFYLGKYPITQAQYQAIMGENPSEFQGAIRPVEQVSWDMAQEFCQKLSKRTGHKFSLPSESQWEYAARAGTTTPFYFGETITTDFANYNGNYLYAGEPEGVYRGESINVGNFPLNLFGLYDMHGNVWEWCEDSWHDNYIDHPNDGTAWITNDENFSRRLLRGGSWSNDPDDCRVASRYTYNRTFINNRIGFRVSCETL